MAQNSLVPVEVAATPALIALKTAEGRSLKALSGWNASAKVLPRGLTMVDVKTDLRATIEALKPIHTRTLAVMVDSFIDHVETFHDLPEDRRGTLTDAYMQTLGEFPEDLAAAAMERVKRTHKWAKPPKPADLYDAVRHDWLERRAARSTLERAVISGRDRPTPVKRVTPEEIAAIKKRRGITHVPGFATEASE